MVVTAVIYTIATVAALKYVYLTLHWLRDVISHDDD